MNVKCSPALAIMSVLLRLAQSAILRGQIVNQSTQYSESVAPARGILGVLGPGFCDTGSHLAGICQGRRDMRLRVTNKSTATLDVS